MSSNLLSFPFQTMVALMGAQFSKPLVANKVTHLICYKFDGNSFCSPNDGNCNEFFIVITCICVNFVFLLLYGWHAYCHCLILLWNLYL